MKRATQTIGVICFLLSGATLGADPVSVKLVASYSPDQGVAYVDEMNPALFHCFTEDQPDTTLSRAEAPYVFQKLDVIFKNGDLVPGKPASITGDDLKIIKGQVEDRFDPPQDQVVDALDYFDKTHKPYVPFKDVKIDDETTVGVAIERYEDTFFISHMYVHHKGKTETVDYKYSSIRTVLPIPDGKGHIDIGVISDGCGNSDCYSEIDIYKIVE